MPYGQTQLVYTLSPQGKSLGITTQEIGRQLRAAYDGYIVQIFQDGFDEIEVRTILADEQRNGFTTLESLPIILPSGEQAALSSLVDFRHQRGFEILRHENGRLAVEVTADVDETQGNTHEITQQLLNQVLPTIAARHNVSYAATGKAADQEETIGEMKVGSLYALALIYLILAWIFSSYGWPLVVMAIIPFAVVGAILGHWLTGIGTVMKNYIMYSGRPTRYHKENSARLGEIWLLPEVKGKTRLVLVDALYPLCDKGPQPDPRYKWTYKGLIAGTDPVAVETVCLKVISEKRNELRGEPWPISPPAVCVEAADKMYGLGTSDMNKITIDSFGWKEGLLV